MHPVELEARRLWERRLLESRYFSRSPSRLCGRAILERFSYFHAASRCLSARLFPCLHFISAFLGFFPSFSVSLH